MAEKAKVQREENGRSEMCQGWGGPGMGCAFLEAEDLEWNGKGFARARRAREHLEASYGEPWEY
jgi:hypothetical protein